MAESGLSPRTVRWVHSVLKMSLDYAIDDGLLPSRNPAARTKFPPQRQTSHTYLIDGRGRGAGPARAAPRATSSRCWPIPVCDSASWSVSASRTSISSAADPGQALHHSGRRQADRGKSEVARPVAGRSRSAARACRFSRDESPDGLLGQPAITSPNGSLLGLENWKRSTRWREAIVEIGRPSLRVHDLRHTYASLARRAGADLRLLQKTMGHASITVTAHIYADLYDDELDDVASALDALDDARADLP